MAFVPEECHREEQVVEKLDRAVEQELVEACLEPVAMSGLALVVLAHPLPPQ